MTRVRRILHPSDFSAASRPAFTKAVEMARQTGGELIIVHVVHDPPMPIAPEIGYLPPKIYQDLWANARNQAQKQLDRLVKKAKAAGVRASSLVLEGVAHDRIARAARRRRADLIVMGTHGRTGLPKLFLGSVAARVIATSPCPVLTVRGR